VRVYRSDLQAHQTRSHRLESGETELRSGESRSNEDARDAIGFPANFRPFRHSNLA
jgi:hypothetical protein